MNVLSRRWFLFTLRRRRAFLVRTYGGHWDRNRLSRVAGIDACLLFCDLIGQTEDPPGSNRGPVVEKLRNWAGRPFKPDKPAGPWCAQAVAGCQLEAVRRLEKEIGRKLKLVSPTSSGTKKWWDRGAAKFIAISSDVWHVKPPKTGDTIIRAGLPGERAPAQSMRDGGSGGDFNHTFMAVGSTDRLIGVEGNTNKSGSANGGEVMWSSYSLTDPRFVGHVEMIVDFDT